MLIIIVTLLNILYIYACMYVCMYIYIYIYTHLTNIIITIISTDIQDFELASKQTADSLIAHYNWICPAVIASSQRGI